MDKYGVRTKMPDNPVQVGTVSACVSDQSEARSETCPNCAKPLVLLDPPGSTQSLIICTDCGTKPFEQ